MLTGVVSLVLIAAAPVPAAKPKPAVTLAEIAAGLRAWRSRIESVSIVTELNYENFPQERLPRESRALRGFSKWAWTRSGQSRWYRWMITYSGAIEDSLQTYDGRFRFDFSSPGGDPPKSPGRVEIRSQTSSQDCPCFSFYRAPFFCIAVGSADPRGTSQWLWLDEHIDRGNARLVGPERIGGRALPVLEIAPLYLKLDERGQRVVARGRVHRLAIDPDHGYLVKKDECSGEIHVTEEFRKVALQGAADVWFPVSGYEEDWFKGKLQYRCRWRVQSVTLNEKLDDALFHPRIPPGSEIKDYTTGRQFTPEPPPADPSSGSETGFPWIEWLFGFVIAAVCVWMCVRTWKKLR